jgi:hypothetical protein
MYGGDQLGIIFVDVVIAEFRHGQRDAFKESAGDASHGNGALSLNASFGHAAEEASERSCNGSGGSKATADRFNTIECGVFDIPGVAKLAVMRDTEFGGIGEAKHAALRAIRVSKSTRRRVVFGEFLGHGSLPRKK